MRIEPERGLIINFEKRILLWQKKNSDRKVRTASLAVTVTNLTTEKEATGITEVKRAAATMLADVHIIRKEETGITALPILLVLMETVKAAISARMETVRSSVRTEIVRMVRTTMTMLRRANVNRITRVMALTAEEAGMAGKIRIIRATREETLVLAMVRRMENARIVRAIITAGKEGTAVRREEASVRAQPIMIRMQNTARRSRSNTRIFWQIRMLPSV